MVLFTSGAAGVKISTFGAVALTTPEAPLTLMTFANGAVVESNLLKVTVTTLVTGTSDATLLAVGPNSVYWIVGFPGAVDSVTPK